MMFEDPPHGGSPDLMAEVGEFALDAPVAPGRIVGGHADDQFADLGGGGWPPWWPVGLGPVSCDPASVPSKQGLGGDEPTDTSRAGERRGDGAEQCPVIVGQLRLFGLASQDGELVAEHDDLEVLRTARARSEPRQRREEAVEDAKHETRDAGHRAWSAPRPNNGHPQGSSMSTETPPDQPRHNIRPPQAA